MSTTGRLVTGRAREPKLQLVRANLADGHDLDGEGVFVVVRGAVDVVADQLLVAAIPAAPRKYLSWSDLCAVMCSMSSKDSHST